MPVKRRGNLFPLAYSVPVYKTDNKRSITEILTVGVINGGVQQLEIFENGQTVSEKQAEIGPTFRNYQHLHIFEVSLQFPKQ